MARTMATHGLPGFVLGIWEEGREPLLIARGLGEIAPNSPMRAGQAFRIASNTKTFTAHVALQLMDEGRLDPGGTIERWFPDLPHADRITVRQLLNMTSGVHEYSDDPAFFGPYSEHPERAWSPEELYAIIRGGEPRFLPGERWQYTDSNYFLLGRILQNVTGRDPAVEIRERILKPLRLDRTSFPSGTALPADSAMGYLPAAGGLVPAPILHPSGPWTGGAMISTPEDLHRWTLARSKGELLGAIGRRESFAWVGAGPTLSYGAGLMKVKSFLGHTGLIRGYESIMVSSPTRRTTFVAYTNLGKEDQHGQPAAGVVMEAIRLFPDE